MEVDEHSFDKPAPYVASQHWRGWVFAVVSPLMISALVAGALYLQYDPAWRVVAKLTGNEIWVDDPNVELGVVPADGKLSKAVRVRNYSNNKVEIVGASVSCGCTSVRGLPLQLDQSEVAEIPLDIDLASRRESGKFTERVVLIVNSQGSIKRFVIVVSGEVEAV